MQVVYEMNVKIKGVYEIDTIENLKDNSEFANGVCQMVCDEIATAGGVGCYEIIESKIDITEKVKDKIYNDFMKNSRH